MVPTEFFLTTFHHPYRTASLLKRYKNEAKFVVAKICQSEPFQQNLEAATKKSLNLKKLRNIIHQDVEVLFRYIFFTLFDVFCENYVFSLPFWEFR